MTRPDIIFIILDTQRADRLGCYGHKRAITPNLDAFASEGTLFERAFAPAQWTIPSHASMFTGLYPNIHQVTQSSQSLSPDLPHLAELLRKVGYQTVGFCNNPLVGILNNGFKRGFDRFYNYGGAIPSLPQSSTAVPWPLNRLLESYTQFLRRISYPIQNYFGRSDLAFRISLNSWLTPLWSRFANFKGQNERSVQDICRFLKGRETRGTQQPLFLFLNLMETHLPYWPPAKYVDEVAPYLRNDKAASEVIRSWNREAFRWGAPLPEPLSDLESRALGDMYDTEVAYQDEYLVRLFDILSTRSNRTNTLTVIASDHGDGLGDHGYFGHAFVAYQELVHVPLILHWPDRLSEPRQVGDTVSIRRIFHTLLDAAGALPEGGFPDSESVQALTLMETIEGEDPEQGTAFCEIFPPLNFLRVVEKYYPKLVEPFGCTAMRRAVVTDWNEGRVWKLIQVNGQPDELFDLTADPKELTDLSPDYPSKVARLNHSINQMVAVSEQTREQFAAGDAVATDDERILQQLRNLGYVE